MSRYQKFITDIMGAQTPASHTYKKVVLRLPSKSLRRASTSHQCSIPTRPSSNNNRQVLMVGHSFIRRMAFDMHQCGLSLSTKSYSVDTIGIGGMTIVGHKPIFPLISHQTDLHKYHLLVADVGPTT